MSSKQLYYVLLLFVGMCGLLVFAVAFGSNEVLESKTAQLSKLKAESQATDVLEESISHSKSDLARYHDLNEIAKAIVPRDKNQMQTVREIVKIAQDSGISQLSSITFPTSDLGNTKSKKSSVTQATPLKDIAGVYVLPITVTVDDEYAVKYEQLIAFLRGLEQNRRTAQVDSINLTPNDKNPNLVSFKLVINEYIKP